MELRYYVGKFLNLKLNIREGKNSPHKILMLIAVMDMIERGKLTENKIFYDDELKATFTKKFKIIAVDLDKDKPWVPYYHLKGSDNDPFWHHKVRCKKADEYEEIEGSSGEKVICDCIEYASVNPDLFEYFKNPSYRKILTLALVENLDKDRRDKLLCPEHALSWEDCKIVLADYFDMITQ